MNDQSIPTLEVINLHKFFGANEVLKGVSLKARAGDVISILGSSGSGKSTLLRCMNLLESPNQGQLLFHNQPIVLERRGEVLKTKRLKAALPDPLEVVDGVPALQFVVAYDGA